MNRGQGPRDVFLFASEKLDGVYGSLTFSSQPDEGESFPDGYQSCAWAEDQLYASESMEVPGLPIGMIVYAVPDHTTATVPGTLYIGNK